VFVQDPTGTHRDEYFFTTGVELPPTEIVAAYTGRWAILPADRLVQRRKPQAGRNLLWPLAAGPEGQDCRELTGDEKADLQTLLADENGNARSRG
jgi:hypothetical protein